MLLTAYESAFRELIGERFTTSNSERDHHGVAESYHPRQPPDAVCYPISITEVVQLVKLCARHDIPIIAFGAGTSLEGHVAALKGGISFNLSRMNAILAVHTDDLDASVQAGVTRKQLNAHLRDTGLFFPIDPGADATLGGMAATRASGTNAVRYGTMRENVIALTVVLADGRIIKTANRARKSSAGYDLTRLFVGSEGTLGIICEVTVRLFGIPEAITSAVCAFPSDEAAIRTAIEVIQCGIPVARVEFMDKRAMLAVNRYSKLNFAEAPTLFFEFHGTHASAQEQASQAREISTNNGARDWQWASEPEARNRLWQARHDMHYATLAMRPGAKVMGTDVCVPISRLAECIRDTRLDADKASFFVTMLGHVGDGNFHLGMLFDPANAAELAEATKINIRLVERALLLEGTCTGEHGIGYGKIRYMRAEHGEAVDVMSALKNALDPCGIMNPGKVLP